jgi:hypothetical protein
MLPASAERCGRAISSCWPLAPQALYTSFDVATGRLRRYGMVRLLAVGAERMGVCRARYLGSAGLLALVGNRMLLRSAQPNRRQIGL